MKLNFDNLYQIDGDVSQKKIYRFKNINENKIIVDFSYNLKDFLSFIKVHNYLSNINISIPKIFEIDENINIIIMEDFGDLRYDKIINNIDPKEILYNAVNSLIQIQNSKKQIPKNDLEQYNFSFLKEEVAEFAEFYIPSTDDGEQLIVDFYNIWKTEFENIKLELNSFVHKDFELSNLIYLPKKDGHLRCGIIDFQNAFLAFVGWDLFSLLENPRMFFNEKYNNELIEYFYKMTGQKNSLNNFIKQYYFLNTARQTRIIGRWIKLNKKNRMNDYSKFLDVTNKRLQKSLFNLKNKKLINIYNRLIIK